MKGIRVKTDGTFTKMLIQDPESGELLLIHEVQVSCHADGSWTANVTIPVRGIDMVSRGSLPIADEEVYQNTKILDTIYGADEVTVNVV